MAEIRSYHEFVAPRVDRASACGLLPPNTSFQVLDGHHATDAGKRPQITEVGRFLDRIHSMIGKGGATFRSNQLKYQHKSTVQHVQYCI